jgi:hypothetical protein
MKKLMLVVVLLSLPAFCEEDEGLAVWSEMKGEVMKASVDFLAKFSTAKERDKFKKSINDKMEARSLETIALDWFYDNEDALRSKDRDAMKQACMLFRLFVETNTPPPLQVRSRITRDSLRELIDYLKSESETAK